MGIIRVSNKINTYNVDESNLHKAEADGYTPVISVSNGEQTHDVHPEDLHLAVADGYKPTSQMPGMGKSALMGAEQGLLLGGADETGGLIQAGLDAGQSGLHNLFPSMVGASPTQTNAALAAAGTTGDVGPTNEAQMYRQAQQENEKDYDIAQKANPGSYLGGTLAGGLLGMKGLGMAKLAPELIAAEKGAPGLRALLAEKGLTPTVMEALKRGAVATVNAAPIGAAYGALDSKGTLENNPLQIAKDSVRGAATAGGIGLGLNLASEVGAPLAGAAAQKIGNKIFDKETLKKFASNRTAAALGIKATQNAKRDIGSTVLEHEALPMTGGSQAINDAIEAAQDQIGKEQINPILKQIQAGLDPNDLSKSQQLASDLTKGFEDFASELNNGSAGPRIVEQMEKELAPYIQQISEAGNNVTKLQAMKQAMQSQSKAAYKAAAIGSMEDAAPKAQMYAKIASMIRDHIENLGNTVSPELGNNLKIANQNWGNLEEASKAATKLIDKDANKSILGLPTSIGGLATGALLGAKTGGLSVAAKVATEQITGNPFGRLVNMGLAKAAKGLTSASGEPNSVLGASKSLYNANAESLNGFGQKLMSTPEGQNTGKALMTALKNNDTTAKNAVLFSIMQQPKLRKLIHGESADQTTDQK